MQIILQKSVINLGLVGDVVDVSPGYYRNFLAPRALAFLANPKSIKQMEHQKRVVEAKKSQAKAESVALKERMEGAVLTLVHAAGSGDKLFGSVTSQEIVLKLKEAGFEVEKRYIQMEAPIKALGEHKIGVKLHPEVVAEIKLSVTRKEGSAEEKAEKEEKPKKKRAKKVEEVAAAPEVQAAPEEKKEKPKKKSKAKKE